jgi:AcrR family transcriptional regulator
VPASPTRRSDRARTAVLDAALALVSEVPYGRLTMEAVAARAGVSKATLYRWWPSKGAVVVEALAEANARDAVYGLPDTGDLETDLATVVRAIVDELADPSHDALLRALSVETLLDAGLRDQVLTTIFRPQLAMFAERFATARASGQVGDVDALEAMELVVAPVFHRWQQGTAPLTHAYADGVARRAVRALEVRKS